MWEINTSKTIAVEFEKVKVSAGAVDAQRWEEVSAPRNQGRLLRRCNSGTSLAG